MEHRVPGGRRGMTLVELLIVLVLFSIVLTSALRMLEVEGEAFSAGSRRMAVVQNYRYAANILEKDLRTTGSGVPATQPFLVYASGDVIAFNADYATNDHDDVFAVYADSTAPDALVSALTRSRRIQIPGSTFSYPDTSYMDGGGNSPAETITFFFAPDSTTAREDDYVLYRQVNDAAREVVARDFLRSGDATFFEYLEPVTPEDEAPRLQVVSDAHLPLRHQAAIHLSAADTAQFARIDNVRAVRTRFLVSNGRTGEDERTVEISRLIHLPNAGRATLRTCGAQPILNTSLQAQPIPAGSGGTDVRLTWTASADEDDGESDVVRYVLWRRPAGALDWGDPIVSIPSGNDSYVYQDTRVEPGTYTYAVAAQDCTPTLSEFTASLPVTVTS